jgi:stage V sporulation protein D (sporulation-specific penicillin-binding protein)
MRGQKWSTTWRVWTVMAAIAIAAGILLARLAQLQILDHQSYAAQARLTHLSEDTLSGRRGALLDRNGYPLAGSQDSYDLMVETNAWSDPARAADAATQLSPIAGVPPEQMMASVSANPIYEVAVARGLSYDQAQAIRDLDLRGVRASPSSRRVYPEGNLAAQLLGIVGQDNSGLTGLESDLDEVLGGAKGTLTYERDGLGNQLAVGERQEVAAQPGGNVVLTIDRYLQRLAETELDKTIEKHKAVGGTILMVQPKTGEILAMASRPTADVTKPDLSDESKLALFRNRAITDTYEPGSVFKLVTMACALDLGLVGPYTPWYDTGTFRVNNWAIRNWDYSANGDEGVTQILTKSLNTGAAWLATLAGPEQFYAYVDRFGFGKTTGSGLGGEVGGQVRTPASDPANWREVDMATNSFGQGLSATPLQVVMSAATIANDGLAMKPKIVKEIAHPGQTDVVTPEPSAQVIKPETARTIREMMGAVAEGISPTLLDVDGYTIGGKTGTANLAADGGGYKPDAYISSFVGIAPLENPVIAVLVKIDEPQGTPWGTVIAAPAFDHIVEAALPYLKVPPTKTAVVSKQ